MRPPSTATGVNQIKEVTTPYTHGLIKRCLNGKNVACARSNEITARLSSEEEGKINFKALFILTSQVLFVVSYSLRLQELPIFSTLRGSLIPPAKRSTIARWMIKYVLFLCSWRCFTNTIMVIMLRTTIDKDSVLSTTIHGLQCNSELIIPTFWLAFS